MTIDRDRDVLIIVDVQNDFCPGGQLAVENGEAVVPVINRLIPQFSMIVATQDWHPADHSSFASQHATGEPFGQTEMAYGPQTLWPDHCVQGTPGADFHKDLDLTRCDLIIRKGFRRSIDSYSAFYENDQVTTTGLAGYLQNRGAGRLYLGGLAADFCVGFSALDGKRDGFDVTVITDACRAIDLDGSLAAMQARWQETGVATIESSEIT